MDPSAQSLLKRGKKACTECRQQKAKCDAYLDPGHPCSRCRKVKTDCIISDPFKREHKRQRLSELEHETDELRKKLKTSGADDVHASSIALLTAAAEIGVQSGPGPRTGTELQVQSSPISSCPQQTMSPVCVGPSLPRIEMPAVRDEPTTPQVLNGVRITGDEIEEIFGLFFTHYAQFLPILDPRTSPNTYMTQSPFLFWAIIGVACRAYARNPTLLNALARSITEMALLSIHSTSAPWHTIQGLLLVLTWPFPKDRNRADVTFPLCGMLLHVAMQNGLHIPMSSHEFSNVKIPAPSEADMMRRSELWAHSVIVYQRACAMKGQSARTLVHLEQDPGQSQVLLEKLAPSLVLKVKCQELVARCSVAVVENGVRTMSIEQERALDVLIRVFERQMNDLEAQTTSEDDKLHARLCRLAIEVFHFFKNQTVLSTGCLSRVLAAACAVVDSIENLGQRLSSLCIAPVQVDFGIFLASMTLLRILKSFPSEDLDIERARSSFFTVINLARQMSFASNDRAAKAVIILNQLWNSTKAFRKSDGTEYTALRIRSRLVHSPVVDAVWWWRDEFDPQARAMGSSQGDASEGTDLSRESSRASFHPSVNALERQEPLHLDDDFLADFEWALGDDGMFPATEPYSATWSSGNLL